MTLGLTLPFILGVGIWLRVRDLPWLLLVGDELHSLWLLGLGYGELLSTYDGAGSGLALPLLQRLTSDLIGQGPLAFRLPALAGGLGSLVLVFLVGRRMVGTAPALLATLALALNPQQIFYSHFGRSYTLVSCLGLLFVLALDHVIADEPLRRRWLVAASLSLAALAFVHLTSAALTVPVASAAVVAVGVGRDQWRLRRLVIALASGAALTTILYLPAWQSTLDFVETKRGQEYHGTFGAMDVYALLAGGRFEGWALLVGSGVGVALWLKARRMDGVLLPAAALGPPLFVAAVDMFGGPYAQARYAMAAVPFKFMLMAWALEQLARRMARRPGLALRAAGAAAVAVSFLLGPQGLARVDDGPFGNTYQALLRVPPFDEPSPGTPSFYQELASDEGDLRVIEAPWLPNRGVRLYRNYFLQHRHETVAGFFRRGVPDGWSPRGNHVPLFGPGWCSGLDAHYLIVHRNVEREANDYWASVYGSGAGTELSSSIVAYMEWNRDPGRVFPSFSPRQESRLREALGEPSYEDRDLLVWRLGPPDARCGR